MLDMAYNRLEKLKRARQVFVDYKSFDESKLIRFYELCSDIFKTSYYKVQEISVRPDIRLVASQVECAIRALPESQRKIICSSYGLDDGKAHTTKQMSEKFALSTSRINQLRRQAFVEILAYENENIFAANFMSSLQISLSKTQEKLEDVMCQLMSLRDIKNQQLIESLSWEGNVRAYNALKRAGVNTVEQLMQLSFEDLISINGIAEVTALQIKKKLQEVSGRV